MTVLAELLPDDPARVGLATEWRDKERVRQVPGRRWDQTRGLWVVPRSWAACPALRGVFGPDLEVGPELAAWAWRDRTERVDPCLALREAQDADLPFEPELYPPQRARVAFLAAARRALDASEMRTGKSVTAIRNLDYLVDPYPVLVVCGSTMRDAWAEEFARWGPALRVQVVRGTAKKRSEQILSAGRGETDVVVLHWELLRYHSRLAPWGSIALSEKERQPLELNDVAWRTVVADEAHHACQPKSKQTRALWAVSEPAEYRYALTGTPLANRPDDLWAVLHFLDPDQFPRKTEFLDRYCVKSFNQWGGLDVYGLRQDTRDELFRVLDPMMRRDLRAVMLPHAPPIERQTRTVDMGAKQARAYAQMRDEALAGDGQGAMAALNPLARATYLSQFACATPVVDERGQVRLAEPSCKVDALLELVDELAGTPCAVYAESRQLIELCEVALTRARVAYRSIRGGVSDAARTDAKAAFQRGEVPVLLVTLGAGGEGLTLTAAPVLVMLQRSWSMVKNKQGEIRNQGVAQTAERTYIIDVVTRDTVEEGRLRTVGDKEDRLEEVVRDRDQMRRLLAWGKKE